MTATHRQRRPSPRVWHAVLVALLFAGCGLDVTFEDNGRNRDLIAQFDPDDAGPPDEVPEPDPEPTPEPQPDPDPGVEPLAVVDHAGWGAVIRRHVTGACFDYDGLARSPEAMDLLRLYLDQLFRVDLDAIESREDRAALWINAYNAMTVMGVVGAREINPDFRVDDEGFSFFRKMQWDVGGLRLSLDAIEHAILRGDTDHPSLSEVEDDALRAAIEAEGQRVGPFDPRLHFALNCASRSCPNLRTEPFTGATLEAQLQSQSEIFLLDRSKGAGPEGISALFLWFRPDFEAVAPIPTFIESLRPGGLDGVDTETYLDYDWSPNDVDPMNPICETGVDGE